MAPVMEKKITLQQINSHLTCPLCKGYFIDATTITECLHTFCRSCIVKHFEKSLFCPVCEIQVDKLHPSEKISPDPRKQLLVYKVVPRLYENEMTRQEKFRKERMQDESQQPLLPRHLPGDTTRDTIVDNVFIYGPDQKISLSLEYESGLLHDTNDSKSAEKQVNAMKRFLQCPAAITVYHLKKFIRLKYEIGPRFEIVISYEGEALSESCSLMDVAYQFFWEAISPMRFTYRIALRNTLKPHERANHQQEPVTTRAPTPPPPPPKSSRAMSRTSSASSTRQVVRSNATTSSSPSVKRAAHRRQVRQRSAKTAAYKSLEAMDEELISDRDYTPPNKKRKSHKSPRWESDDSSFDSFTIYRCTRSGKTPKPSAQDNEGRYLPRPGIKTVYSAAVSSSMTDDSASSDTELSETRSDSRSCRVSSTKNSDHKGSVVGQRKNNICFSKSRSFSERKKPTAVTDVYEFHSNNEDTNEDSNTTVEYEFVYDENKDSESDGQENNFVVDEDRHSIKKQESCEDSMDETELKRKIFSDQVSKDMDQEQQASTGKVEENVQGDEQQVEMNIMTEKDLEQHIEDSIEEVEIDVDGDEDQNEASQCVEDMDAETASTCLVIAEEEEEDDGVVEEVIAAEEDGHELVVLETPENIATSYVDADTTNGSLAASRSQDQKAVQQSSVYSSKCSSGNGFSVDDEEPEILHERVSRKKSKKTKHHHHHHHHKHRHRHSPVLLVSSAEEAPMKLTLKLRPTPSISPTNNNASKVQQNDAVHKQRKLSSKGGQPETKITISSKPSYNKTPKQVYSVSSRLVKSSPARSESPDIKSPTPEPLSPLNPSPEEFSPKSPTPEPLSPRPSSPAEKREPSPTPEQVLVTQSNQSSVTAANKETVKNSSEKEGKDSESKVRSVQARAARLSSGSSSSSNGPDLKRVKTPASLIISKVEAGEMPPRLQQECRKPALEILMLPPSPPSAIRESEVCKSRSDKASSKDPESSVTQSSASKISLVSSDREPKSADSQIGALDLSGRAKRIDPVVNGLKKSSSRSVSDITRKNYAGPSLGNDKNAIPPQNDGNVAQPHDLGLVPKSSLVAIQSLMHIGITNREHIAAKLMTGLPSNGQGMRHMIPSIPSHALGPLGASQRGRPMPGLNDLFPNKRLGNYSITATSRPNQTVRHIPNPSALFQRQQHQQQQIQESIKKQQGQLTEAQLKERYQLFQQNQAARGVQTYSRTNNTSALKAAGIANRNVGAVRPVIGGLTNGPQFFSTNQINNNILMKNAGRNRSIEKVAAGLLSVRSTNFPLEAQAGL